MYIVYGIDHDGNESKRLEYASVEEALHKVGDLIGADEIDDNGPMFREYGLAIDPMPQGPCTEGLYDEDGERMPVPAPGNDPTGFIPPPAPEDEPPELRLRRD